MKRLDDIIDEGMKERIARRAAELFAEDPGSPRWAYSFDDVEIVDEKGSPSDALIDFARGRVEAAINLMRSHFHAGSASAWRAVSGDEDLVNEIARSGEIGIYWTWVPEAAFSHWGDAGEFDVIFRAEIGVDDVNWPLTILANALDAGADEGFHEAEIRLRPDAVVRVLAASIRDQEDIFYDCSYNDLTPIDIRVLDGLPLKAGRAGSVDDGLLHSNEVNPEPVVWAFS